MINYYSNITLLTLLVVILLKQYKRRAWLHPGLWFALIWISATICYRICVLANFYQEYFPQYIDSLNTKIFFTGICFITIAIIDKIRNAHKSNLLPFNLNRYVKIYGFCSLTALGGAIGTWIYNGASFNIVSNRFAMIAGHNDIVFGYTGAAANGSIIEGILYKCFVLNIPCALLAGSMLALALNYNRKKIPRKELFFLAIPFLSACFMTISNGGRRGYVDICMLYTIGFLLSFSCMASFNKKRLRAYIIGILVFTLSFVIFSTVVRKARTAERYGSLYAGALFQDNFSFLEPASGVIIYLADPFVGYQIKSKYRPSTKLSYGEKTFNGLFSFSIPVIDRIFHLRVSIADYLGWKPLSNSRWMAEDIPMATTVESIYYYLVADYGENGSLIAIAILTLISHKVFTFFLRKRKKNTFFSTYFLLIFLLFWVNSIFDGYFAGPMPGATFKSFLFCELFRHVTTYQKYDFSFGAFQSFLPKKQPKKRKIYST